LRGQSSAFPTDFAGRPYNTLTVLCEHVIQSVISCEVHDNDHNAILPSGSRLVWFGSLTLLLSFIAVVSVIDFAKFLASKPSRRPNRKIKSVDGSY